MALCDHDSTDNSYLLPELFAQRGVGGVVFDRAPKPRQTEFNNSIDEQLACMDQCFERYRNDTDWFIIAVRLTEALDGNAAIEEPRKMSSALPSRRHRNDWLGIETNRLLCALLRCELAATSSTDCLVHNLL